MTETGLTSERFLSPRMTTYIRKRRAHATEIVRAAVPTEPIHILRWVLTAFGVIGAMMVVRAVQSSVPGDALGLLQADPYQPYTGAQLGGEGAYLYAPIVVQALAPFRALPGFIDAWRAAEAASLVILAGPFSLAILMVPPSIQELRLANVNIILGAMIVGGFRWPALWSFVLLTKVTPGIGLLWFVARREWRHLGIAFAATLVLASISFAAAPSAWLDWIALLVREGSHDLGPGWDVLLPFPLAFRLLVAAGIVLWGASEDHRWAVIVAAYIALPSTWTTAMTMLIGVIPLAGFEWRSRRLPGSSIALSS